jgi:Fur family transcriptional regulator, iron response regulator
MDVGSPTRPVIERLAEAGLRTTRQRVGLARLLFDKGDRHITAEQLHSEAQTAGIKVSLATVYNTVNQFTEVGLLREVVVESGRSYFDTNTTDHHHFFIRSEGRLSDVGDGLVLEGLPDPPEGTEIERIDIIVRLRPVGRSKTSG